MRSGNPALRGNAFSAMRSYNPSQAMTLQGTVNKGFILLFFVILGASWVWHNPVHYLPFVWPAAIGGFIIALVTIFKKEWSPITSPIYALVEGVFLGVISALMEQHYPGIVMRAVILTFGTLFCLLAAYKSRLIRVTAKFRLGVFAATGGIAVLYFMTFILNFFGVQVPFIYGSGPIGIGVSLFIVIIAALNLVIDFDFIERGVQANVPRYMEWYGAFALMVTLIWLYLEILRLLAKLNRR